MSSKDVIAILLIALGFFLQAIPMPDLLVEYSIAWVILACIIWQLISPQSVPFIAVAIIGLLLDVQKGTLLGSHVAALSLVMMIAESMQRRFQIFNLIQQTAFIFMMIMAAQLTIYLLTLVITERQFDVVVWQPALVSALLWPWVSSLVLARFQKIR